MRHSEIETALKIFSDVFPSERVTTISDVNHFLDSCKDRDEVRAFEDRLSNHYEDLSANYLLNRSLAHPNQWQDFTVAQEIEVDSESSSQLIDEESERDEEFTYDLTYETVQSEEPSSPTFVSKDFEQEEVPGEVPSSPVIAPVDLRQEEVGQEEEIDPSMSWGDFVKAINSSFVHRNFKEQEIREIKDLGEQGFELTFLDGTILNVQKTEEGKLHLSGTALPHFIQKQFNQALGRGSENIFPFDQIQSVTVLSEDSNPKLKIDFGREVEGMVDNGSSDGWEDMKYHRLVVGPSLVVQLSKDNGIQFEEGNI